MVLRVLESRRAVGHPSSWLVAQKASRVEEEEEDEDEDEEDDGGWWLVQAEVGGGGVDVV